MSTDIRSSAKAEQKKRNSAHWNLIEIKQSLSKTDKSVSLGKTRIHSKELQLSDFHHEMNVSSLADLLWQTHKRGMLKNKTQSYRNATQPAQEQAERYDSVFLSLRWWLVFGLFDVPLQTQEFDEIKGHTFLAIRIADERTCMARPGDVAHLFTCTTDHTCICLGHWLLGCVPHFSAVLHLSAKIFSQTTNQFSLK